MAYTTATVNGWYQAVQFQNGPTATVNSWVSGLNSGSITPTQVQNSIITQDAYTLGVVNPVLRLYQSSFNSVPDQAGEAYWVGQFGSGAQTYAQIANGFANSTQFKGIYGNTSSTQIANTAQVTLLYQNILQRLPDTAGLAYWTTQTIGTALAGISSSPEMVSVSSLPIQNYQAAEIAGTAAGSGSLYNYPGFPTTTYVLTTGVDAPGTGAFASSTGGVSVGNNASVYGTINGTGATFNSGDVVTAASGAVNDSLILSDLGGAATFNLNSVVATVSNIPTVTVSSSGSITFNAPAGGYAGMTQFTLSGAGQQTITTASTTNTTVTNQTITAGQGIIVQGGKNVTATQTAGDNGVAVQLGAVTVGNVTAAAGTVTVNDTQTISVAGSNAGNAVVAATSGATVNYTVNETTAQAAANAPIQAPLAPVANQAGTISVTNTSGAVVVNSATTINALATIATNAAGIYVNGGTTITVNETASAIQTATSVSTITMGAVVVAGNANTTTVTVTQPSVATGKIVTSAAAAVNGVNGVAAVTAAPGQQAVTAVAQVAAAAAVTAVATGTPTITANGVVTINDKNAASATLTNTISTVSLTGYAGGSAVNSNALTSLTLGGTGGTLSLGNTTGATNGTLGLTLSSLAVSAAGVSNAITFANNQVSTLNIVSNGTANAILGTGGNYNTTALTDANLTAVNVSGTGVLTIGAFSANPTTINVTGSAGYTGLVNSTATAFNASGTSGVITVGIGATPTKAITAGSATTDTIVLTALGVADSTTSTANYSTFNTNVTGFNQLGVAVTGGTWDMSKLTGTYTGLNVYNTTVWTGAAPGVSATFTKVAQGTSLTLGGTQTNAVGTISYQSVDTSGATDSLALTLAGGTTGFTTASLTVQDANAVGYGTLNVTSNASTLSSSNTITALADTGLSNLSLAGTGGLTINNALTLTSTSLTIANNSTMQPASVAAGAAGTLAAYNGSLTFTNGISDNTLGSITFTGSGNTIFSSATGLADTATNLNLTNSGTGKVYINTYAAGAGGAAVTFAGSGQFDIGTMTTTATGVSLTNNGTGSVWVGGGAAAGFVDAALTSLTLSGAVQFGQNNGVAMTATGATTGVTVAAGTDHQHINFNLTGAAVGNTDTITLGNGNNLFIDGSSAGTVGMTVGSGSNYLKLGATTNTTLTASVTAAAHTAAGIDQFVVGTAGNSFATLYNTAITGAQTGDVISFANDVASSSAALTKTTLTAYGTLAGAIGALEALTNTAHKVAYGTWTDGNTYLVESKTGTVAANDTTVTQIVGNVTLTASNGYVTVGSAAATGAQGFSSVYGVTDTAALAAAQSFTSYFNDTYSLTQAAGQGALVTMTGATSNGTVDLSASNAVAGASINVSSSTGAWTLKGGTQVDTITAGSGTTSITGGAGADTISLLSGHTNVNTIVYSAANQGGATAAYGAATVPAAGDVVSNFATATDIVNFNAVVTAGGHTAATFNQGGWNATTNGVGILTGTYVSAGSAATDLQLSTALGNITAAANGKFVFLIETSAASGVYNAYELDTVTAIAGAALSTTDGTISLLGTYTGNAANWTTANVVA